MNIPTIEEDQLIEYINKHQGPLVIAIRMKNCPPCNMMEPKLKATMQDYQDEIEVGKNKSHRRLSADGPV